MTTSETLGPTGNTGQVWQIVDGAEGGIEICHRPPENPENARTITVGASAVPAHLSHGDSLGACE